MKKSVSPRKSFRKGNYKNLFDRMNRIDRIKTCYNPVYLVFILGVVKFFLCLRTVVKKNILTGYGMLKEKKG
jgi:hypothetical protein